MEFVEIHNPTGFAVNLAHWRLSGGIDYSLTGTLGARQTLVVVPFDPADAVLLAAFRARYNAAAAVVVGPYSGHLNDYGEKVQLLRPDSPPAEAPAFYPGLLEDEVTYAPSWGGAADGRSLQRAAVSAWGDTAPSWTSAGAATPGTVAFTRAMTWKGLGSGLWTDPTQWNGAPPAYPNSTVDAIIATAGNTVTVSAIEQADSVAVSNTAAVTIAAAASLTVLADVTVATGASLQVAEGGAFSTGGAVTVAGGTLSLPASPAGPITVGGLIVEAGGSVAGGSLIAGFVELQDGTVSTSLSGPGTLTKTTAGTAVLSAPNSYTGGTVVSAGTLNVAIVGALPTGQDLVIGAGAQVVLAVGMVAQAASAATAAVELPSAVGGPATPAQAASLAQAQPATMGVEVVLAGPGIVVQTLQEQAAEPAPATIASSQPSASTLATRAPAATTPAKAGTTNSRAAAHDAVLAGHRPRAFVPDASWLIAGESWGQRKHAPRKSGPAANAVDEVLAQATLTGP
jgi:autotransporter-associated beta strand protein